MKYSDKRVLIVEDQRPFLLMLKGLLQSMGATNIVTKSSAEQAISEAKRTKFDIVVCDLHLGADYKNGYELVEELRVKRLIKTTSVFILISADSTRSMVLGSIDRRPDDFLVKPFSQVQLKSRISRAWQKRQFLQQAYEFIEKEQFTDAITVLNTLYKEPSHYKGHCEQLLVETYCRKNDCKRALAILAPYTSGKPVLWAQIALGKTYIQNADYDKAITIAMKTLKRNRFSADANDVLALAHQGLENREAALNAIKEAIKLSPYSVSRHLQACEIAKQNLDFVTASLSCSAIWNLSKRTVHKNSLHWCTLIRSLLDVAEHSEDQKQRNKYQQEALLALQRGKFDEHLLKMDRNFDVDIFGNIVNARVSAIDGKLIDAKKHLVNSQVAIEEKYPEHPTAYLPDSINVMYTLGEYDDALALSKIVATRKDELDQNSASMLEQKAEKAKTNLANYQQFNREGIQHYQQNSFERAKASFALAQNYAPVNIGVALNLLQCLLQLFKIIDKADSQMAGECRRLYKLLDNIPLKDAYSEKYSNLRDDLSLFLGL
ncbi:MULTISPECIES: response regulator [unclassified Alteromonas]|uniref:response regulator n=1 Tax=unclassified Alteromonas TaxID=2614992 RepID=UPI0005099E70|nr:MULTISPECIES: response regulator [unclassified Alteromonas]